MRFASLVGGGDAGVNSFFKSFSPSDSRGQSQENVPFTQLRVRGRGSGIGTAAIRGLTGFAAGTGTFAGSLCSDA